MISYKYYRGGGKSLNSNPLFVFDIQRFATKGSITSKELFVYSLPEDYEDPDNYNYYCVGKFEFDESILNKKIDYAELYITVGSIGIPNVIFDLNNKFEKGNPYDSIYLWVTVENETASVCISSSGTNALPMDSSNFFEEDRISSPGLEMNLGVRATLVLYTLDDESSGNSKLISLDRAKDFLDKAKTIFFMQTDHLSNDEITTLVDGIMNPQPADLSNYAKVHISNYQNITEIPQENLNYLNSGLVASDMSYMFDSCYGLKTIPKLNIDISQCVNMSSMFGNCSALTTIDLSNFDTSNVTDMTDMFYDCRALTTINLSNFNTSSVTDMGYMFYNCRLLTTIDLSNFNTSKVTNMNSMFYLCQTLTTVDLSNFNTSNVTDMGYMFYSCRALTSLDLSNWDTSKVTNMEFMFNNCRNLEHIEGIIDMKSCTSSYTMFYNCPKLTGVKIKNPPADFEFETKLNSSQYEIVS